MSWVLYYLSIYLMTAGIRLSALWNDKSKMWVKGRKNWFQKINLLPVKANTRIWFHVASLGEFEQARPVMEMIKRAKPETELILTFFSPSGYSIKSDYPLASVFYLPVDLPGNANKWIKHVQPDFALFVKYDLWPGFLRALQKHKIPSILISAHWKPDGLFHSSALPLTRSLLKKFDQIFLQKSDHLDYFKGKGFSNLQVAGDSRIDRSLELPNEASSRIPDILRESPSFDVIAGSTWPPDEKILIAATEKLNLRMILAPHDVSTENITRLMKTLPRNSIRLSEVSIPDFKERIVVVDSIGLLNVLYSLGHIAYVGGGFGAGIHNTLEPIAHRKPVIFGPAYGKFPEAIDLIGLHAAWSVLDAAELKNLLEHLLESKNYEKAGEIAFNYLVSNSGASEKISHYILESIEQRN